MNAVCWEDAGLVAERAGEVCGVVNLATLADLLDSLGWDGERFRMAVRLAQCKGWVSLQPAERPVSAREAEAGVWSWAEGELLVYVLVPGDA